LAEVVVEEAAEDTFTRGPKSLHLTVMETSTTEVAIRGTEDPETTISSSFIEAEEEEATSEMVGEEVGQISTLHEANPLIALGVLQNVPLSKVVIVVSLTLRATRAVMAAVAPTPLRIHSRSNA